MFLLQTSPNQTQFLSTGAVVDFSSVAPVSKNRPRCEHSSSEIAIFGHDPGSDAETGPEEVREVLQTAPKSSYVRNGPAIKQTCAFRVRLSHFSDQNRHKLIIFDDVGGGVFSTTGTRETHHFSKSLRLSTKFKTLAPVDKSWHRSVRKYAFYSSFESEMCVFAVPVQ